MLDTLCAARLDRALDAHCSEMINSFPSYWEAPYQLYGLDGNCGPVTAWGILRYFRKRTSSARIIEACRYTKKHGTFTIALAVALREHGLSVTFYSDPDPNPTRIEKRCYRIAHHTGVRIEAAIDLDSLIAKINLNTIPIVFYFTDEDDGHFSPVLGLEHRKLILPYTDKGTISISEFQRRWNEPDVFRQCIVVSL